MDEANDEVVELGIGEIVCLFLVFSIFLLFILHIVSLGIVFGHDDEL